MTLKILLQLGTRQYHHLNLRALVISGVSGFIQVGTLLTSEDGMVGIFLQNMSNESIKVQFGFAVKNNGRISNVDFLSQKEGYDFAASGTRDVNNQKHFSIGNSNFCKRSTIIENLVDGTLIIEVRMRTMGTLHRSSLLIPLSRPFYICSTMRNRLMLYSR